MNERWLPIEGYEGIYEVSDLGNVRRIVSRSGNPLVRQIKPKANYLGYLAVNLCRDKVQRTFKVHRLVAVAFLGSPTSPRMEVRHIDGTRDNARLENLQWGTHSENMLDSVAHGTHNAVRRKST